MSLTWGGQPGRRGPSAKALKRQMGQLSPEKSWMWGKGSRNPECPSQHQGFLSALGTLGPTLTFAFSTPREKLDLLALQEVLVLAALR